MRKETLVTISAEGRDKGKVFKLTEMSAFEIEDWAARAFLAIARGGVDVDPALASSGIAGLVALGLRSFSGVQYPDLKPLLDEMMGCVQIIPDPTNPSVCRPFLRSEIEEVSTVLKLREEVLELHTGFFGKFKAWMAQVVSLMVADGTNTATSVALSEPSSAADEPA